MKMSSAESSGASIVKEPLRLTKEKISDMVMEIACGLHNLRVTFRQPLQIIDILDYKKDSYFL